MACVDRPRAMRVYIDVIDPATNKVVHTIGNIESPEVVRFSPDGSRLYIPFRGENNLIVMDRKERKDYQEGAPQRLAQRSNRD